MIRLDHQIGIKIVQGNLPDIDGWRIQIRPYAVDVDGVPLEQIIAQCIHGPETVEAGVTVEGDDRQFVGRCL